VVGACSVAGTRARTAVRPTVNCLPARHRQGKAAGSAVAVRPPAGLPVPWLAVFWQQPMQLAATLRLQAIDGCWPSSLQNLMIQRP
jgi:hypothetical protein